jgi:tetratricopeptide (TPR) repeat protein
MNRSFNYSHREQRLRGSAAATVLLMLVLSGCGSPAPRTTRPYSPPSPAVAASTAPESSGSKQSEADERFQQALQLLRQHQTEQAQAMLIALSNDFPEYSGPLTALGVSYAQARKRGQAIESFAKAAQANPNNVVALNWLGSLYRESGDFKRAEESYQLALKAKPDYAPAQLNLGILYDISLKQPQKALQAYRSYQQLLGADDVTPRALMVGVWIKEIESAESPRAASVETAR